MGVFCCTTSTWTTGISVISGDPHEVCTLCKEGQLDKALILLLHLDQQECGVSVRMYESILHACEKKKALPQAKRVQQHMAQCGLQFNSFLSELLVATLINCGGLVDGVELFQQLSHRTAFSWTAIIAGYCNAGHHRVALTCYQQMQQEGVQPDNYTFVVVLKACAKLKDLEKGKQIHAAALACGFGSDVFVGSSLVSMYAKCGSIIDAQQVFNGLSCRNVVSWNAMLAAYAQLDQGEKALQLYQEMQAEGVTPNARTFASTLQACGSLAEIDGGTVLNGVVLKVESLQKGKEIHAGACTRGFDLDVFVGSALVSMYAKCGSIDDAQLIFDRLSQRNVVSWNALIAAYAQLDQGEMALQNFWQMQEEGVRPDARTFVSTLQACSSLPGKEEGELVDGRLVKVQSLRKGRVVHAEATRMNFDSDIFVRCTLISMYAKCGSLKDAQLAFDASARHNVVLWTSMIAAYAQQDEEGKALEIFEQMQELEVLPDARTYVIALQACGSLAEKEVYTVVDSQNVKVQCLEKGKKIHAASTGVFDSDVYVGSVLVSMYARCGSVADAEQVFDKLSQRNVASWTAMIAAYAQQKQGERALKVYQHMQENGITPDAWTFVSILQACGSLAEHEEDAVVNGRHLKVETLRKGREMHSLAAQKGFESNMFVANSLITMYTKCGSIEDAKHVFDMMTNRNVVSWTCMISAYAQQDQGEKALQLYTGMQADGVKPHECTFLAVLEACSGTGALEVCKETHKSIVESGFADRLSVATSLIYAYGKCGSMSNAELVFQSLAQPDVVSWTALITGYARLGSLEMAIRHYGDLCKDGLQPQGATFLALLSACNHAGRVDKGLEYFESMVRDYAIPGTLEHYACVIDLLSRAGCFSQAEKLLAQMPMRPDLPLWLCLLGACQKYGNVVLGRYAFDRAVSGEPKHGAAYVLMANIYADAGLWNSANDVHELREFAGAWKEPGQSWIEHKQAVHTFLAGDHRHQQEAVIYQLLNELSEQVEASRAY